MLLALNIFSKLKFIPVALGVNHATTGRDARRTRRRDACATYASEIWHRFGLVMAISALVLGAVAASAAMPQTLHSRSGQFIVRGLPLKPSITGPGFQSLPDASQENISYIRLDPAVLVVACERVKQEILAELGQIGRAHV